MRRCLLSLFTLVGLSGVGQWSAGAVSCVDPATLVHSTVGLTREFSMEERAAAPAVLGIRGTGWFLSPRLLVTAAHVAEAMRLSRQDWKDVALREQEAETAVPARIVRVVGAHAEKMAVLELKGAFAGAAALRVRTAPLVAEERLLSLAYPNGELRFASGRFAQYGDEGGFAGAAMIEMYDGNDRLVLDHGASGAPVLDCEGRVVAVVSTLMTRTLNLPTGAVRVSTAWQTPNVLSIPAEDLAGVSRTE
jgi:hypothetical protein